MTGRYDCPNKACKTYHELREAEYQDHGKAPKCKSCRGKLRLVRVIRPMPESVKARLRGDK